MFLVSNIKLHQVFLTMEMEMLAMVILSDKENKFR